jgi:amidase
MVCDQHTGEGAFMRAGLSGALAAALLLGACASVPQYATDQEAGASRFLTVEERSIAELQADMAAGRATSEAITRAYLDRIARIDRSGPTLRSVIATSPDAVEQARRLDAERAAGRVRGPLHGVPVLIKDNIETRELPTTAGSLALLANDPRRDSPSVARLRDAGAVILGKTNLSAWANIRSTRSISGWSAVGGLVRNPYALDRNACGSSSGSGAAAAASLAAATVGTETSGSIVCPSTVNGVVGMKPTVGLVSRTHVVPISHSLDTPGPMTRTVADAAALLTAMAGTDPVDPATAEADARKRDYTAALDVNALRGKRIGVMRFTAGQHPEVDALFDRAVADLRAAGAEPVEIAVAPTLQQVGASIQLILSTELKADMAKYLASTPAAVKPRTLADLIAFNRAEAAREMPLFDQDRFEAAEKTAGLDDPAYRETLATARRLAGPEGLDKMLSDNRVVALVGISGGPAWPSDAAGASRGVVGGSSLLPAVAGYPHLTVPMGDVRGLPVGLSFVGPAWSEAELFALGYAYEQATRRRKPPSYLPTIDVRPDVARAYAPATR